MQELATGVGDVGRGLAVLKAHPSLLKWLIAPAVITAIVLVLAVLGILHAIDPLVGWATGHLPGWLASLAGLLLRLILLAALASAGLFLFATVAGAIAGPFNEILSERVEAALGGGQPSPFSLGELLRGVAVGIAHSIRRLASALFGLAIVFAVGFVPVIGTIAALVLAAWLAAGAASYDCYDAVLSRRSMAYRDKLAYLARHRGRTFGLGLTVTGMLLVPGVNLVAFGLGAVGATVADRALRRDAQA